MQIKLNLAEGVQMPSYQTEGAAGADVTANTIKKVYSSKKEVSEEVLERVKASFIERDYILMRPGERILFGTGITVAGFSSNNLEIQVRPRSGTSLKKGLTVLNSPGTIDNDYRGEIGVILVNPTKGLVKIEKGERIAQIVVSEFIKVNFKSTEELEESERGSGGFGSTGTK